jgi:hypothetical protein
MNFCHQMDIHEMAIYRVAQTPAKRKGFKPFSVSGLIASVMERSVDRIVSRVQHILFQRTNTAECSFVHEVSIQL